MTLSIKKYTGAHMIAELYRMPIEQLSRYLFQKATATTATLYYLNPYYYCAVCNPSHVPTHINGTEQTWEKVAFKQGRTTHRTLDGNQPQEHPLNLVHGEIYV